MAPVHGDAGQQLDWPLLLTEEDVGGGVVALPLDGPSGGVSVRVDGLQRPSLLVGPYGAGAEPAGAAEVGDPLAHRRPVPHRAPRAGEAPQQAPEGVGEDLDVLCLPE